MESIVDYARIAKMANFGGHQELLEALLAWDFEEESVQAKRSNLADPTPFATDRWLLPYKQTHADMEEFGLAAWRSIQAKDVDNRLADFEFEVESETLYLLAVRAGLVGETVLDEALALIYAAALLGNRLALEAIGELIDVNGPTPRLPFSCGSGADPDAIVAGLRLLIEIARNPPDVVYRPEIFHFYSKPIPWQDLTKELAAIGFDVDGWRQERRNRLDNATLDRFRQSMSRATAEALRESASVDALYASLNKKPLPEPLIAVTPKFSPPVGQQKIVLRAIGDSESNDGKSAERRYGRLLEPLDIRPAKISADECFDRLNAEFPWLEEANAEIAGAVALCRQGNGHFFCPPLLLDGPPGIGKTRWSRRIGEILDTGWGWLSLAGIHSAMPINGAERGWSGGHSCFAVDTLLTAECANPVVLLDEVDKTSGGGHNGDPVSALLPLLERETAARFRDNFLLAEVDLSSIVWVLTSNDYRLLPSTLLLRTEIIACPPPELGHIPPIITVMARDVAEIYGIAEEAIPALDVQSLVDVYARQRDLRSLQKSVTRMVVRGLWKKAPLRLDGGPGQRVPMGFAASPVRSGL